MEELRRVDCSGSVLGVLPTAFIPASPEGSYQQFAVTIAISVVLSALTHSR